MLATGLLAHCCLQEILKFYFRSMIRNCTVIHSEASKGGGAHSFIEIILAAKIAQMFAASLIQLGSILIMS